MCHCYRMFLAGLVIIGLAGCAGTAPNLPPETMPGSGPGHNVLVESYKIAVGDQVQVNVWKKPEHSVTEPVRPDGKISIPLVGDVMAAGLEPQELAADVEERLKAYVLKPRVTVILTSLQGHAFLSRIRVTGSVANNMSMPYYQGMTVLDAVLEAGGVDVYADGNRTKLYRRVGDVSETYDIHLKDILEKGDKRTNVYLVPGDVITVPPRRF